MPVTNITFTRQIKCPVCIRTSEDWRVPSSKFYYLKHTPSWGLIVNYVPRGWGAGIWSPLIRGGEFDRWPQCHVTSRADSTGLINHGGDGVDVKLWWIQRKRLRNCGGLVENQRPTQTVFRIWRCLRMICILHIVESFISYVPVKSKLQHPPGQPPGYLNFWKIFVQIPPSPGRKAVQMPPPPGKLQGCFFNFSVAFIMLLKLCM